MTTIGLWLMTYSDNLGATRLRKRARANGQSVEETLSTLTKAETKTLARDSKTVDAA